MATEAQRNTYLLRHYGLTIQQWNSILELQGGGCAGCGALGKTRSLHTDHDHKTGVVRGILCAACNAALRKLKDSASTARNLAEYLETPPCTTVLGRQLVAPNPPVNKRRRYRRGRQLVGSGGP